MARKLGEDPRALVGNVELSRKLKPADYVDAFGLLTIVDIVSELEKPGRDPRRDFRVDSTNRSAVLLT